MHPPANEKYKAMCRAEHRRIFDKWTKYAANNRDFRQRRGFEPLPENLTGIDWDPYYGRPLSYARGNGWMTSETDWAEPEWEDIPQPLEYPRRPTKGGYDNDYPQKHTRKRVSTRISQIRWIREEAEEIKAVRDARWRLAKERADKAAAELKEQHMQRYREYEAFWAKQSEEDQAEHQEHLARYFSLINKV